MVGLVAGTPLTESDVIAGDQAEFRGLESDLQRSQQQLRLKFAKLRYDLLETRTDKMLDQRAVEAEAKARGLSSKEILSGIPAGRPVTDAEAQAFYDAHRGRLSQPFDQVALQIRIYLAKQHAEAAARSFFDSLRAKHDIISTLAPYTLSVAASGPSRGPNDALVTIVEFGDFQCPYCREAESTLRSVLAGYPRQVRLVFRNLPLSQLHPNAEIAARAAICADRQQRFWPMHDAMYSDQKQLDIDGLKLTAARLGLDGERFAACLRDASTDGALAVDAKAADELGISETPFFLVNGQPIDGSIPVEQFRQIIEGELHRLGNSTKRRLASN